MASPGSSSSRGGRGPAGGVIVSARKTIGASRPLAPCTVITRTSSRAISMSRFTSARASRSQAMKPCSEGVSRRSYSIARLRNSSSASLASAPSRARKCRRAPIGAENFSVEHKRRLAPRGLGKLVELGLRRYRYEFAFGRLAPESPRAATSDHGRRPRQKDRRRRSRIGDCAARSRAPDRPAATTARRRAPSDPSRRYAR